MRVVFAHSHTFISDGKAVWSPGAFSYESWARYLDVFKEIVVIGRSRLLRPDEDKSRLTQCSGPNVSFVFVPDIASVRATVSGDRRRAIRTIRSCIQHADAVIARIPTQIGTLAAEIAHHEGKPCAVEVTGCAWSVFWNHGSVAGKFYAPIRMLATRRALRMAPFAIYVTSEFLQRRYPCRGYVANASNVQIADPDPVTLEQRLQRIASPRKTLVIGQIASLQHRAKGIQTALAALSHLISTSQDLPHLEFRILGPGSPTPWQAEAARLGVADRVRFCGSLPSGDPVLRWLDEVDLYIQPSLIEGLPRGLIEAMSRGCPALASNVGGIPELLDSDCLHSPLDHRKLACLIRSLAVDQAWQENQARKNFNVSRSYSATSIGCRRKRFWESFARYVAESIA